MNDYLEGLEHFEVKQCSETSQKIALFLGF